MGVSVAGEFWSDIPRTGFIDELVAEDKTLEMVTYPSQATHILLTRERGGSKARARVFVSIDSPVSIRERKAAWVSFGEVTDASFFDELRGYTGVKVVTFGGAYRAQVRQF